MKCVRVHRAQRSVGAFIMHRVRLHHVAMLVTAFALSACASVGQLLRGVQTASRMQQAMALFTGARVASRSMREAGSSKEKEQLVAGAPMVDTTEFNWTNRNIDMCLGACDDILYTYTTPAYVSMDQERSLALVYNWASVHPTMTITLDVKDTNTTKTANVISMEVLDSTNTPLESVRSTSKSHLYFTNQPGTWRRIAIRYGAVAMQNYTTGVHPFTARVTSHFTDSTSSYVDVPIRAIVVNERANPLASGWNVAALQRLYTMKDSSVVLVEGNGTALFYDVPCASAPCTYKTPLGEFSTLSKHTSRGDSTLYDRRYPDGTVAAFDSSGYLLYYSDRFGNKTSFTYNVTTHRVQTIVDPVNNQFSVVEGGSPSSYGGPQILITDPGNRVTYLNEDDSSNVREIIDASGARAFYADYYSAHALHGYQNRAGEAWYPRYDCAAHGHGLTEPDIMVNGSVFTPIVYYAHVDVATTACAGDVAGSSNGLGYTLGTPAPSTTPDSARARITNPRGITTAYAVDRFGAPTRIEEPMGRVTIIERDSASRVKRTVSPLGEIIKYTWIGTNITQVFDSTLGRTINYGYDTTYNLPTSVSGHAPAITNTLDSTKRLIVATSVAGATASQYKYDSRGRDSISIDPLGHTTSKHYASDTWKNNDYVVQANGARYTRTFDALGRTDSLKNTLNGATKTVYDALNRTTMTISPSSDTTRFGYDSLFLASVKDARGQVWQYTHNALGWPTSTIDPQSHGQYNTYDANGNVIAWTNRRGQVTTFTYDSLDRRLTMNTDSTAPMRTTTYRYDPAFHWIYATNAYSSDTIQFDDAGRVVNEYTSHGVPKSLSSVYNDTLGVRSYSGGRAEIYYWYNASGQLTSVLDPFFMTYIQGYSADRQPSAIGYAYGSFGDTLQYSSLHDATKHAFNPLDGANDQQFQYAVRHDTLGRLSERFRYPIDSMHSWVDTSRVYDYDALGRLSGYYDQRRTVRSCGFDAQHNMVCAPNSVDTLAYHSFLYDAVGNLVDSLTTQIDYGDRVRDYRNHHLSYDLDGNMSANQTVGGSVDSLHWNQLNELSEFDRGSLSRVLFGYDGFGRRVLKATISGSDTTNTRYRWDGDNVVGQQQTGAFPVEYGFYPGVDQPLFVREGNMVTGYHVRDAEGNVAGLMDAFGGGPLAVYRYTPFGEMERNDSLPSMNELRFQGRPYDPETGLYYFRARYYDPQQRRFISEDPVGLAGGINPYVFAENDPVNSADPSGLIPCTPEQLAHGWSKTTSDDGSTECLSPHMLEGMTATAERTALWDVFVSNLSWSFRQQWGEGMHWQNVPVNQGMVPSWIGGPVGSTAAAVHTADQAALVALAKRFNKTGITREEATIMRDWAAEYGIPFRGPESHPTRAFGQYVHYLIGPYRHILLR